MAADLQRPRGSDLAMDRHEAQNPSFFSHLQSLLSHAPSSRDVVEAVTANMRIRLNAHLLSLASWHFFLFPVYSSLHFPNTLFY